MKTLRVGCGAGFAGDRIDPAVDLVERGDLDVLVLECLAERTIALAQKAKLTSGVGYDPLLERRIRPLVTGLSRTGTRLITNMGAADPAGAASKTAEVCRSEGSDLGVAYVTGDDVLADIDLHAPAWEDGIPLAEHGEIVSANAYLGSDAILLGLQTGAAIIITGRVADPSLFVAPLVAAFGWSLDDWPRLGQATAIGHLLECGPQVSGGYFADPPYKIVNDLANVGYPIAEVDVDGSATIFKLSGTGGRVDELTVAEQLGYEVCDPAAYLTPDVSADFTSLTVHQQATNIVKVDGGNGRVAPDSLKVSVGYRAGFRCEAEISYGGRGATDRARLAAEVVTTRLGGRMPDLRWDLIGVNSVYGESDRVEEPAECRLRLCGSSLDKDVALTIAEETMALYTAGPAGGSGVRSRVEEVIGVVSTSIPREAVKPAAHLVTSDNDRSADMSVGGR